MLSPVEIEKLSKELAQLEEQKQCIINAANEVVRNLMESALMKNTTSRIEIIKLELDNNYKNHVQRINKVINRYFKLTFVLPSGKKIIHQAKDLVLEKIKYQSVVTPVLEQTLVKFVEEHQDIERCDLVNLCDVVENIFQEYGSEKKVFQFVVERECAIVTNKFIQPYIEQIETVYDEFCENHNLVFGQIPSLQNAKRFILKEVNKASGGCDVTIVLEKAMREYVKKIQQESLDFEWVICNFFNAINQKFNKFQTFVPKPRRNLNVELLSSEDEFVKYTYKYSNPEKIRLLKGMNIVHPNNSMVCMLEKDSNKVKNFKRSGLVRI